MSQVNQVCQKYKVGRDNPVIVELRVILGNRMGYLTTGEYIVPKREYKPYMDLILDRVNDIGDPLLNNPKYFDQSLSFDTRCIQYIIGKVGSSKFRQILNETEYYEEVVEYTKNGKLENIVDIINEIKDIDTCLLKNN